MSTLSTWPTLHAIRCHCSEFPHAVRIVALALLSKPVLKSHLQLQLHRHTRSHLSRSTLCYTHQFVASLCYVNTTDTELCSCFSSDLSTLILKASPYHGSADSPLGSRFCWISCCSFVQHAGEVCDSSSCLGHGYRPWTTCYNTKHGIGIDDLTAAGLVFPRLEHFCIPSTCLVELVDCSPERCQPRDSYQLQ